MSKHPYKFGKYTLVGKIAQGGMAEIYRAKYSGEGGFVKDVAVKRILPVWSDNKEFITMLCDEAKALVHLQHQNIVQIYELGKDGDTFYISMELVEGVDLRQLFKKNVTASEIPISFVCFITAEILKALDFAHNKKDKQGSPLGIIHRDISPQNVLLSYNGEVKVADFGIAKGAHRTFETAVAQVKGKYAYMSPEQAQGLPVDGRSDLYAVGVILYELITRKRLYDAPNDLLTIEQVKRSVMPDSWENGVPMGVRPIIRRSLQKDAADRYQTAASFLDDINRFVTANKLMTHGLELSAYLKEIFKEEYKNNSSEENLETGPAEIDLKPQTKILKLISNSGVSSPGKRKYFIGAGSFLVICVAVFFVWKNMQDPAQLSNDTVLSVPTIPPLKKASPKIVVSQPPPTLEKEKPQVIGGGSLNVSARPWGYVYVPGVIDRQETPVKGVKLKSGDYVVKVNFEPEDKWVQQKISIAENSNTICTANFVNEQNLTCRTSKSQ